MQKLTTLSNIYNFGKLNRHFYRFSFTCYLLLFSLITSAQTILERGDIALLGVNANSSVCGGTVGQDEITFVSFRDITNNTEIDVTDNGWERSNVGQWGDSEGTYRLTRSGGTITAGTSFTITFQNDLAATQAANPGWTITDLNVPSSLSRTLNFNSGGDQIYVMQDGNWDNQGETGEHDAGYDGKILYGFNTRSTWNADGTTQQSNLHPQVDPCYFMNPTGGTTNYVNYSGPTTPTTQLEWINRIADPSNWNTYVSCIDYDLDPPPASISITPSGMSIECSVCSGCGTINDVLTFNLPTTGGPFNIFYTDGTDLFTLNGISDGHTVNVTVTQNTTYSLLSVTDVNSCPVFSNFDGEAVITVDGGGGSASIAGGGVICTGNCTEVTVSITGGAAPYDVTMSLDFPPFINDFQFDLDLPTTLFTLNVCVDGLIPLYDPATNTLTIPEFIGNNVSLSLVDMMDNSGCGGTVDPTPLNFDIQQTPTANPAGPLEACDDGSGMATFDLTDLDAAIGSGNLVSWFTDMNATSQIANPSNYTSSSTTVYATTTSGSCESEVISVMLNINVTPTPSSTSATLCGDENGMATFDLTLLDPDVNGGSGSTVNWYLDMGGNTPINPANNFNTNSTTVYATVSAGICESATVPVMLTVNTTPAANTASLDACDDGSGAATFNLSDLDIVVNGGSGNSVSWFEDAAGGVLIPDPANYLSGSGSVYANVTNGICTSPLVQIILTVNPSPTAIPTNDTQCDDGSGQASFDLTLLDFIVNGATSNNVSWYLDAAGITAVPDPTDYLSTGGSVWAIVSNGVCDSEIVEIMLMVENAPTAIPTSDQACDDGSGTATFNLTNLDFTVNDGTGNLVTWYLDMNAVAEIADPSNFNSGATSVYAIVSNGACNSAIVEITLSLNNAPSANPTNAQACDDGTGMATFNLNDLNETVNGNSGNPVTWYFDMDATAQITDPSNLTTGSISVYAVVFDGVCNSPAVEVSLIINSTPTAIPTSAQACDDGSGSATFNLTNLNFIVNDGSANTVTWYLDINAVAEISNPASFDTPSTSVYAIVTDGNCASQIVEIVLTVENQITANPTSAQACDDGTGIASFNLTDLDAIVGSGNTVTWYEDAAASTEVPDPTDLNTTSTSVYAIVTDGNCASQIVEIVLTVENQITANPTSAQACDDGTGSATFNLTNLNFIVNDGSANTVTWYLDINAVAEISNPTSFDTPSTSVYAIVTDGNCTSQIVEIVLTVENQISANPTSAQACDDGTGVASFNLTDLDAIVGSGNTVTWYEDAAASTEVPDPTDLNTASTSVYAIVTDGNCASQIVEIVLTVENQITANPTSAQACDDGTGIASFNLTDLDAIVGSGNTVTWYEDAAASTEVPNPTDLNTASTSVYAIVTDGNCASQIVEIVLTVENQITANPTSAQACDDGTGIASFNLTDLDAIVGSGNTVTWYEDAAASTEVPDPTDLNTASTSVYAIVTDGDCASQIVEIVLTVENQITANPTSAQACDDGTGIASFNLTDLDAIVGSGNTVTWYEDAAASTEVPDPTELNTASTSVYAIVTDGDCASQIVEIVLTVENQITANPTSAQACDDGTGIASFNLTDLDAIVGSGNTVTWYEDAAASTVVPNPTDLNTASTSVYAIVTDGDCASQIVEIVLTVENQITANPTSAQACDDGTGIASFNLTDLDAIVGSGNTVTWYEDAAASTEVPNPTNLNTTSTSVYAIVTDGDCASQIVEIVLTVENQISANPTSAQACDDGTGIASFNLTDLDGIVGSGNTVTWYEDAAASTEVPNPTDLNTASTSVYAIVTDGDCASQIVEIVLTVENQITANPTSAQACDDGTGIASFNLTDLDIIVGSGNTVTWYEDAAASTEVPDPTDLNTASTSVYAIVTDGDCASQIVEIVLTVENQITANPTSAQACDDGTGIASFNLTNLNAIVGSGNTVTWYEDAAASTEVPDPTDLNTTSTSVYAIVTDGDCASQIVEIVLTVENQISANPTSAQACDDGTGTASFNLTDLDGIVGSGNTVTWYEDAAASTEVPDPTDLNTTSTSVYAIVTDGDCASQIVEIVLTVENQITANPTSAQACDDGTGIASFNLTDLDGIVGSGNTVTWYEDAAASTEVPDPTDLNTTSTSVYAIVTDGNCASQIVEIVLTVENQISANPTSAQACDDGTGTASFNLTDLDGIVGSGNTVTWYEDAAASTEVPDPTDLNTTSTSVYAIVTDGDCASQIVEIVLTVENQITANPTSAQACDDGTGIASFNLTDLDAIVGSGNTVTWYEDAAASTEVPDPTDLNTASTSVYAIVTDGNCASQIVEIVLTVENQISANPTSAQACDDGTGIASFNLTDLDGIVGSGNTVTWYEDAAASTEVPDPSDLNTASTSVYAIVTDGDCASQIVEIVLTVENQITANPTSAQACDDGTGIASFNLTDLDAIVGSGNTVTWYEDAAASTEVSDPTDLNTASTSVYAIVTDGDCASQIVEIVLTVENQITANPTSAQACDDGTGIASFNLTDLDAIVGSGNTVTWYEDAVASTEVSDPSDLNTGTTSVYAIVTDGNCASQIVEIVLTVENQISANPTSAQACDDGTGIASFNLTDLDAIVGSGNTVTWYEDAAASTEVSDPTDLNTASTSVYAIVTDGDCASQIVEIVLTVENQISANPTSAQACDDGTGIASFNLTDLDAIVGSGNTVTWYEDAVASTEVSDPSDLNTGTTSVYAIVTDGNCASQIVEIVLTVENQISANPTSAQACDDGTGIASFNLTDLDAIVGSGNTVTWYEDAAASTEVPDPSDLNTASTSVYAIVTDGNCTSQIVEIVLTVENQISANPTSAQACDDGTGIASFNLTDLDAIVGSDNTVTWYEDAAASTEVPNPTDLNTTSTSVYAIVTDGNCASQIVEIVLTVENQISANPTSAQACDDGTGIASFNLTELDAIVGSGNTVIWYEDAAASTVVPNPTDLNTASTSVYAIVTDGDCASQIVEIVLTVENLPIANPSSLNACSEGSTFGDFELNDIENEVNGGTGSIVSWYEDINASIPITNTNLTSVTTTVYAVVEGSNCNSAPVPVDLIVLQPVLSNFYDEFCENESIIINGTTYDINNSSGTETFVGASANGCDSIVSILIDFYDPILGSIEGSNTICNGQSTILTFNLSGANTYDIIYSDGINPDVVLNNILDGHTISVSPNNTTTYTLLEVIGTDIPCDATIASNSITVQVTNINSEINILSDFQGFGISCNGMNDGSIEAIPLSGSAPFTYLWNTNETSPSLNNLASGNYTVTITDAMGCTTESTVQLTEPPAIEISYQTISPECFGDTDGSIIIDSINGVGSPFEFSIDGEFFSSVPTFPFILNSLEAGNYELTIQDINDCSVKEEILVVPPIENQIDLGEDITIDLGDSVQIEAFPNFETTEIIWNTLEIGCIDCLDPFVTPTETSSYSITAIDTFGCTVSDDIIVYVKKDRNIFIPTVFSPNGDGFNDLFFVNTDQSAINISKFRIFNRWGETIYSANDLQPNNTTLGWNGMFKGEEMNPGVFVYLIEIEFIDGRVELYKGDFTLLK